MMQPEISIIVTNHNYSKYLIECINSCVGQHTSLNYEVIVVDDGSADDSIGIIESCLNNKVCLLQLNNSGIEVASNAGIKNTKGSLIVRVDADDYLMPEYLDTIVAKLKNSDCSFAYPDYFVVDDAGEILYEEKLPPFRPDEVIERGDFLATGTLYRKTIVEELGCYDESVRNCGLENYYLVLKLIKARHSGLHIPHTLFAYRRHALNLSSQKKEAIINYGRSIFMKLGLGTYRTNSFHPYKLEAKDE